MTSDPSDVNQSMQSSITFNRFAYTNGDPVLKSDKRGLGDPRPGDPEDHESGCYWDPISHSLNCPLVEIPRWPEPPPPGTPPSTPPEGGSPAPPGTGQGGDGPKPGSMDATRKALGDAARVISTMKFSVVCQDAINSIVHNKEVGDNKWEMVGADNATVGELMDRALLVKFVDGTTTHLYWMDGNTKRYYRDAFEKDPELYAQTPVPGTVQFWRPGYEIGKDPSEVRGAVLHELLHSIGFSDTDVQLGLKISVQDKTDNITQTLQEKCFK